MNIFWFRRDLRLEDNVGLFHALNSDEDVLPIFIFANTGLNFNNFQFEYFLQPMIISVVLSVLVGKQMGFLLFILPPRLHHQA